MVVPHADKATNVELKAADGLNITVLPRMESVAHLGQVLPSPPGLFDRTIGSQLLRAGLHSLAPVWGSSDTYQPLGGGLGPTPVGF